MKRLLIVGAGGHGKVVAEVAESIGYEEIAFLDDNSPDAIGKISEIGRFKEQYSDAFVGIGNNKLRGELIQKLLHDNPRSKSACSGKWSNGK